MTRGRVEIEVEAKLTVPLETAETCLRLVAAFLNANNNFRLHTMKNDNGTISLYLVDYSGADKEEEKQ